MSGILRACVELSASSCLSVCVWRFTRVFPPVKRTCVLFAYVGRSGLDVHVCICTCLHLYHRRVCPMYMNSSVMSTSFSSRFCFRFLTERERNRRLSGLKKGLAFLCSHLSFFHSPSFPSTSRPPTGSSCLSVCICTRSLWSTCMYISGHACTSVGRSRSLRVRVPLGPCIYGGLDVHFHLCVRTWEVFVSIGLCQRVPGLCV